MNNQLKRRIRDIELQRKVCELKRENRQNYTKTELNMMAKVTGIRYFVKIKKYELARKLGIDLEPKLKRARSRNVEIINSDGTTTTYPSMTQAAKAIGIFSSQIYTMVDKGKAKFV